MAIKKSFKKYLIEEFTFRFNTFKRWKRGRTIKFLYVSDWECNLNNPQFGYWGCCCQCINNLKITKHCWHSNYSRSCNCNEELGFYVCILNHDIDNWYDKACLGTKHGVCEGFQKRLERPKKRELNESN